MPIISGRAAWIISDMAKAVWNGAVIAESDDTIEVEGNQYFPPDAVKREYLVETQTHTT